MIGLSVGRLDVLDMDILHYIERHPNDTQAQVRRQLRRHQEADYHVQPAVSSQCG